MNLVRLYLTILLVTIWPHCLEAACNPSCVGGNGFCSSNVCRCLPGWDGVDCGTDKDECASNNGGCQTVCTNTPGSFSCGCDTGYEVALNGFACVDIDECATGTDTCDTVSSTCRNTVGSFECDCNTGYEVSAPETCVDIDECARGTDLCDDFCVNTIGSYVCYCLDESQLLLEDGFSCSTNCVVDSECNGPTNGECLNGNCECVAGRQGVDCASDIDECTSSNGGCQQNCINLAGSFECSCDIGYTIDTVDSALCLDVNECTGDNICHEHAHCINAVGNYQCECKTGFTGSGVQCDAVRPPDMMKHAATQRLRPLWTVAFHTLIIHLVIPVQMQ